MTSQFRTRFPVVLLLLLSCLGCSEESPDAPGPLDPGSTPDLATLLVQITPDGGAIPWTLSGPAGFLVSAVHDTTLTDLSLGTYELNVAVPDSVLMREPPSREMVLTGPDAVTVPITIYLNVLKVPEGEAVELEGGLHQFEAIDIQGSVFLYPEANPVSFICESFRIGASGRLSGKNQYAFSPGNPSTGIEVMAEEVCIQGRLDSDGASFVDYTFGPMPVLRDGGSISISADSMNISGTVSATGSRGLCVMDDIMFEFFASPGTDGGELSLWADSDLVITGNLLLGGGDGVNTCENSCEGGDAGNGGSIRINLTGGLDGAVVNVSGGQGGEASNGCPAGQDGLSAGGFLGVGWNQSGEAVRNYPLNPSLNRHFGAGHFGAGP